jgi:hypothetical protein
LQKQKALQEAVKLQQSGQARAVLARQAAEAEEVAQKEAQVAKAKPKAKKAAKKVTKAVAKKAAKKVVKKLKVIKWSEDDTQKVLHQKAKKAGLDVRSKDWKSEIVQAIEKHNKKASK